MSPLTLLLVALLQPPAPQLAATQPPPQPPAAMQLDVQPAAAAPAPLDGSPLGELAERPAEELLLDANRAYEQGSYGQAVALYEALAARGIENGHLHYNLGNSYLRDGRLGQAVAAYRRARALLPRDQDVAANLAFARRSTRDALAPPSPSPVATTLFFWHYGLSRPELLKLTALLGLLFWLTMALRLRSPGSEVLRWTAGALCVLTLATGASLALHTVAPQRIAVVLPQEIEARSGTGVDTVLRFRLQAGSEVELLERRGEWLRIALPDGQQGWIEADHAEIVTF